MRKYIVLIAALLLIPVTTLKSQESSTIPTAKKRPTVGLVLGGGGAKGAAHIGVLKYLEEIGMPIDYITGTSIGSIIGGMYSLGYTADELDTIISGMDWNWYMSNSEDRSHHSTGGRKHMDTYVFSVPFNTGKLKDVASNVFLSSLPSGFISGTRLVNLFSSLAVGYNDSVDFSQLPIPFACIATDIVSGDSVILNHGSLPWSIRASMAIPGAFAPVYTDNHVLVDGGLKDNIPIDVCRNMGADLIIAVGLGGEDETTEKDLQSLPQLLMRLVNIEVLSDTSSITPGHDILLKPDVSGYNTLSFNTEAIDTLIRRGYEVAAAHRDELLAIKALTDINGYSNTQLNAPRAKDFSKDTLKLAKIIYKGVPEEDERWLRINDRIYEEEYVTRADIERCVSEIQGSGYYNDVTYTIQLVDTTQDYDRCNLTISLKQAEPHDFSIGLRVDSEESASLLLHLGINQYRPSGFQLNLDGKLNHNPMLGISLGHSGRSDFSWLLGYKFHQSHFSQGISYSREYSNTTISNHNIQLSLNKSTNRNNTYTFGLEEDVRVIDPYLDVNQLLFSDLADVFNSPGHLGAFARFSFDNFNDGYFPTQGSNMLLDLHYRIANYGFYSILNTNNNGYWGFGDLTFNLQHVIPVGRRLCLIPHLYNRILVGGSDTMSYHLYDNYVGGVLAGRYFDQQMPFIGFNTPQRVGDFAHVLRLDLRVNIGTSHYITLMGNYMLSADDIKSYFASDDSFHNALGIGLRYSYKFSIGGPISFDIHWSTLTHNVGFYFNWGCMF